MLSTVIWLARPLAGADLREKRCRRSTLRSASCSGFPSEPLPLSLGPCCTLQHYLEYPPQSSRLPYFIFHMLMAGELHGVCERAGDRDCSLALVVIASVCGIPYILCMGMMHY